MKTFQSRDGFSYSSAVRETGLSERTVRNSIGVLIKEGLLVRHEEGENNKIWYQINMRPYFFQYASKSMSIYDGSLGDKVETEMYLKEKSYDRFIAQHNRIVSLEVKQKKSIEKSDERWGRKNAV